jgi:hypothetical protein
MADEPTVTQPKDRNPRWGLERSLRAASIPPEGKLIMFALLTYTGGCKQSAHARVVMGGAGWDCRLRGECLRGRSPGPAEHEVVQDVHGVAAVLAGGVDVTADVEPVLGDVVAGQAAGDLLLGLQRANAAL